MSAAWLKVKGWFLAAGITLFTLAYVFLSGRRKGKVDEVVRRSAEEKDVLQNRIEQKQTEQQKVQEVKNDVNSMPDNAVDKRGNDKWMRD